MSFNQKRRKDLEWREDFFPLQFIKRFVCVIYTNTRIKTTKYSFSEALRNLKIYNKEKIKNCNFAWISKQNAT